MMINLRTCVNTQPEPLQLVLRERLPENITEPCVLDCRYQVVEQEDYYTLTLDVAGEINLVCQRCLQSFLYSYKNNTTLAVCQTDACAERLFSQYESLVSESYIIDLKDILVDELHLYSLRNHPDSQDCDKEIFQYLGVSEEPC